MDPTEQNNNNSTQAVNNSAVQNANNVTVPTQITGREVQSAGPEASMVGNQNAVENSTNKKKNKKIIGIIVAIVLVLVVGGVVATLFLTGVIKLGDESAPDGPMPTPELAKSVCEAYDGRYFSVDVPDENIQSAHYCEKIMNDNNGSITMFSYEIHFLNDANNEEHQKRIESALSNNFYTILENSDDFKKLYMLNSNSNCILSAFYKNVEIDIAAVSNSLGEKLLVELGFPDRGEVASNYSVENQTSDDIDNTEKDKKYRDTLSNLRSSVRNYQANNRAQLPTISNGEFENFDSYLEASDFVDEATGNKYTLVAFDSFADSEYATNDSLLNSIPSDQIYVFYNANCEKNKITAAENPRKVVFVHSSAKNDKYYCETN